MMVKAKPLSKLCEFQGQELPEWYKSDCYGNVDETIFACKEKKRIMVRKKYTLKLCLKITTNPTTDDGFVQITN
jgi:hypothetical protein